MFRTLRITVLLYVLVIVALTTWSARARNTDWNDSLWVVIYPINAAGSDEVGSYIDDLTEAQFQPIETVMAQQARSWGVELEKPIDIKLAPEVDSLPPAPPTSGNPVSIAWWSLRLRFWAWRNDSFDGPSDIRLYAAFYDPAEHTRLAHSLGLQKGFLGVVNGYGKTIYEGRNNVVLAHEMLHTLGASDKYDADTNHAHFPDGFAEPERQPLYPQTHAELMAGRIQVSDVESKMPGALIQTVVGRKTALEIGWVN